MAQEIERKFLVDTDRLPKTEGKLYVQGYLSEGGNTVRVRIIGDKAVLTIKGKSEGVSRPEFEYDIPVEDAREMMKLCKEPPVEKIRHLIEHEGHTWEVDEFLGANKGLWLAEIELNDENEAFEMPDWVGDEVSHDRRYYNSQLAVQPFTTWNNAADRNCSPS